MMMLLPGRPIVARCNAMSAGVRISSRPASSGGGVPAPGAYGLRIGSTAQESMRILAILQEIDKIPKI